MSTLSTHVLDAQFGRPAAAMAVRIDLADGTTRTGTTDDDGRLRLPDPVPTGHAAITFATGPWFAAADRVTFYPEVRIDVTVADADEHYHVALLLSPFSYTTYRGS